MAKCSYGKSIPSAFEGWNADDYTPVDFSPALQINASPRKVGQVVWHPAAQHVLASAVGDHTVKLWEFFHHAEIDRSRDRDFRRKANWYSRTRRPTKYLLIDFGLSRRYGLANGSQLDKLYRGGDKSAPEHQDVTRPCNPFPTDVYYLGNVIREYFMQVQAFLLSSKYYRTDR